MEENKIITATAARAIAEHNTLTIDGAIAQIHERAKEGREEAVYIGLLISDDLKNELLKLGYSIRTAKGLMGESLFIVSW